MVFPLIFPYKEGLGVESSFSGDPSLPISAKHYSDHHRDRTPHIQGARAAKSEIAGITSPFARNQITGHRCRT